MTTSLLRALTAATFILITAAACAGTSAQWTFAPASHAAESAGPGESAAPAESAAPGESEAPGGPSAPTESAATGESAAPAQSATPAESGVPSASEPPAGEARPIDLQATVSLQFATADGQRLTDIPVTPGETVLLRVDNTAGFDHNFFIGTDQELKDAQDGLPGIPTWTSGVQELEWLVPDDVTGLKFGCTVPGHYQSMQGTFSTVS